MIHEIGNDRIRIRVKSLGAELTSLQHAGGFEYLWQGSEDSWTGQSPILFPVIGGLPEGRYTWQGKRYEMASHGFARKKEWQLLENESGADRLVLELIDDADTRAQYPFSFRLRIIYELRDSGFSLSYQVKNTGDGLLPFSIGGHPAFRCPLEEGKSFGDYQLTFERPEKTLRYMKGEALLTGEAREFVLEDGILPLDYKDYADCAVILRKFESRSITLEGRPGGISGRRSVKVDFDGFPDLGIWTHKNAKGPYICIEPWFGVDSTEEEEADSDFSTKTGMIQLPAGDEFKAGFRVDIT